MSMRLKRRRKLRAGYWYGLLQQAVAADRQERGEPPDLSEDEILGWADAFFASQGDWPRFDSGPIPESSGETWLTVAAALALGLRGLPAGGTLPRFFARHRGRYNQSDQDFSGEQIMAWAKSWRAETGRWPTTVSGEIPGQGGLTWLGVDMALRKGRGGLHDGSSLLHFLTGQRHLVHHTPLTEEQILIWADAHHHRTGRWPHGHSGPVLDAPGETWAAISFVLIKGFRSLPGGLTLSQLLIKHRGIRSAACLPPLSIPQILSWADAHHARTGRWPDLRAGPIPESHGESWRTLQDALVNGNRGIPGGSSLAQLLIQQRGVRNPRRPPDLSVPQILVWADAFHARTACWPKPRSGLIPEAPGETWRTVERALKRGDRGLPGRSRLAQLLAQRRGWPYPLRRPALTVPQILAWADAFRARSGTYPSRRSGPIPHAPGETWMAVDGALRTGVRGLPGGSGLTRLLAQHRGWRRPSRRPALTVSQILAWADAFRAGNGHWPSRKSGLILEAPGETWEAADRALRRGLRGLPGGSSLPRLITGK